MELLEDSDCGPCNLKSRRGRIPKKRKHTNQSRPSKRANACSICKKSDHIKHSLLCSEYKLEAFFYTRPGGIKIWESTICHWACQICEWTWAIYKRRKRNNSTSTNEGKEEEYERLLVDFMDKHDDGLPDLWGEDPNTADFEGFLPRPRKSWKQVCN